jgi:hypothetical protein
MAKWIERNLPSEKLELELTQDEWELLPQCVKDFNSSTVFSGFDQWAAAIVALPFLMDQFEVKREFTDGYTAGHQQYYMTRFFNDATMHLRAKNYDLLKAIREPLLPKHGYPTGGDAVLLTAEWPWAGSSAKVGTFGIINRRNGGQYDDLQVTWNYSAFRGFSYRGAVACDLRKDNTSEGLRDHVSVSGGPGTICLPTRLLQPTDATTWVWFWCWRSIPQAQGSMQYQLEVPVWTWDGKGYGSE